MVLNQVLWLELKEFRFESVFVAVRRNDGNAGIQDSSERRCDNA
jgi:hypothetical protein